MKFTLILNSHSLSNFQACETRHLYSDIISVKGNGRNSHAEVGTEVARWLEMYYSQKIRGKSSKLKALFNADLWYKRFIERIDKCSMEDSRKYLSVCMAYAKHYQFETWEPIAVEKGFSKVLYEDNENLFLYEGRPDLFGRNQTYDFVADHKCQFREYDIYPYSNQPFGYLWALGVKEFVYNYLKILKKDFEFRRTPITFEQRAIDNWVGVTTEWYFRLKNSIERKSFLPSSQCTTQYGKCAYTSLCECTTDAQRMFVINTNFQIKKKYRSW